MMNPTSAPVAKSWMPSLLPIDTDKSSYWRGTVPPSCSPLYKVVLPIRLTLGIIENA
jgi:hypothetical protein